jgi:hypothetical protein
MVQRQPKLILNATLHIQRIEAQVVVISRNVCINSLVDSLVKF